MKKIIAIILILLVGLFFVSGCASTSEPETKEQGQGTQAPGQQNPNLNFMNIFVSFT